MEEIGSFIRSFFANISIMLAFMYGGSLLYRYWIYKLAQAYREALFVALAIAGGWMTMQYGVRFGNSVLFDLRYMVIIAAPMLVTRKLSIVVIGAGVGLARLTYGMHEAAFVGCFNVIAMSLACAAIIRWTERIGWGFYKKMSVVIVSVNTLNVIVIALFGVIPASVYLRHIAPGAYALSLLLSFMFVAVLRELIVEAGRNSQLQAYSEMMEVQYRLAEKKTEELQAAKLELERKNEQILLSARYKTEFLANMSHEVRTPLNSMLVFSQMLEENPDGRLSEDEVNYARMIHSSGEQLLKLISNVLDLSRIDAVAAEIERSAYGISELLQHLTYEYEPLIREKGLDFTIRREEAVPETIYTDGARLQQIMGNILTNAVKFTEEGGIDLSVYRACNFNGVVGGVLSSGDWLAFSVSDTGIGIPENEQSAVFDAFHQVDGSTSRLYGGTGLGLAISKQLAELMGGFISLESRKGAGSLFTLYLPWAETTKAE